MIIWLTKSDITKFGNFDHSGVEYVDVDRISGSAILLIQNSDDVHTNFSRTICDSEEAKNKKLHDRCQVNSISASTVQW